MTRIALVTGGGSGIGRAAARALADDGWTLVLAGRRRDPLEETAAMLDAQTLCITADVSRPDDVRALFAAAVERFGRLDLLFNNAGLSLPSTCVDEIADEDWLRLVSVNLNGAFFCLREAFAVMKAQQPQGGRIINNGSISAHVPRLHSAAYTATKHAVHGLTKSTALDGRAFNIACGQIDIGNAATDMASGMMQGALQADGEVRAEPVIDVAAAGRAVAQMAALPLDANVLSMTLMASTMPYVGRG